MKFWVTQDRLLVDAATADLRGGLQDATEGAVTASTGSWSTATAPATDGSWRVSVPLEIGVNEITVTATDGAGLTSTWTGTVIRLITDRVKADLDALNAILRRFASGTETEADWAAINAPNQRGAYNYTDLNRVSAAAELVYQSLVGQGFVVDYDRLVIHPDEPEPDNPLPDGYTELEYIESDGDQYINTGFVPGSNTQIHADFQFLGVSAHTALYGQRGASPNYANRFDFGYVVSSNAFRFDFGAGNVTFPTSISWKSRYTLDVDGNSCSLLSDGDVVGQVNASDVTFTGGYPLYLFAINTAGIVGEISTLRLYSFQILSGGAAARDFIPCKNPDGVVGLFDSVGGSFYANQGTGAFTAGPEVPPPEPPEPVDPYAWQETDIPTASQMAQYLANVANLLEARLVQAQYITLPQSMASLTLAGANNIEWALVCVDAVTPVARKSYIYSGEAMAGEF